MTDRTASLILGLDKARHLDGLQKCVIELQDFERRIEPRMPPGAEIADAYLADMFKRCDEGGGRVLIAEIDGNVAGYATVLPKVKSENIEDGDLEYGLISDLVVLRDYRGCGLGRDLLKAAEQYAKTCKVKYLRLGVLADNHIAKKIYSSAGYSPVYVELEKVLTRS